MSLADVIIIIVIALIIIAIVYLQFIRHGYYPCDSCPKKKRCASINGESLKEYYRKVCAKEKNEEQTKIKSCCKKDWFFIKP